jgi:PAS domain S-box-containing protein
MVTASRVTQFKIPLYLISIFLLLFFAISATGLLYYNKQKAAITADTQRELATLAAFKVFEVRQWREQRIEDAQVIIDNLYFPVRVQEWLRNESLPGHRQEILSWMTGRRYRLDYEEIYLLDTTGAVRLSASKKSVPLAPNLQDLTSEAFRIRKPVFSDLYTTDNSSHIHIDLLVPLLIPDAGDSIPVGVLVLGIDPRTSFYPLLQSSPVRTTTGEMLLVKRDGESVLFLNELRFRKNAALSLKMPLSGQSLPAARAVQGHEGVCEGIDYRGEAVLAAITAIPDSPWFLIAKIDTAEVLGPALREVVFISILILAFVAVAGISIMLFWRQQQLDAERHQYALELERRSISQQYEYLKKYANDIILLFDEQGVILEANDRALSAYGYRREELLQMPVSQLRAPETRSTFAADMQIIGRQGGLVFETVHQRKDGSTFPVEISARLMELEGRKLYQSIVRDITERKKAEEEIARRDVLLGRVAKSSSYLLAAADVSAVIPGVLEGIGHDAGVDRVYVFNNHDDPQTGEHRMSQLYEWSHETVTPQIDNPELQSLSYGSFPGWYEILASGSSVKGFVRDFTETIRSHLEPQNIRSLLLVPINIAGAFWGFIGFDDCKQARAWSDSEISILSTLAGSIGNAIQRRQAEQDQERLQVQLYQSQKMEAVGHLAGGIAHDFNNILTAIMGYGSLLQAKLNEKDPLRSHVDQILTSAERAAALVRSLLAYSRKQIINPKPVTINEIVVNVENMLHRIIGEDINLQTKLSEHDTTAVADAGQIEQLLINLATNARDAMPAGGLLTIITGRAEMDEEFIKAHGYGTQGTYVLLAVSDTGSGMDEKTRRQIFEPFFTTKEVGKGTGLGLSTVYGIVKQHNGFINCYSEPGRGTTFKIYLPLVTRPSGPAVQPSAIARPPVLQGGSETILLAEDDDDLRKLIRQVLEDFGYTVLEAADGDAAMALFTEHHNDINLLLLDIIMPKKNGREAYIEMRKIEPAIKALFTSGYTADIIHKQGLLEQGLEFILKPVLPTELLKKVRDVLDK